MTKLLSKLLENIREAMFRPINTAAIGILGVFSLLWGVWVSNPIWSVFERAEIFEGMQFWFPEWVWGVAAIAVGVSMLYGVASNNFKSLRAGALTGFYFWLFASISFFVGDWRNTGGITLMMIALYCGYVALNLSINKEYFLEK